MITKSPLSKVTLTYLGLICLGLSIVTLIVYMQVRNHEFLNLDDNNYVTHNSNVADGITINNVIWAFTSVKNEVGFWHPVTWLSHMMDVQFYGMNPSGHHLTSVAIHIVSSLLLLLLLFRLTGALWQSSFVAALFALHPTHVESVAWAAERKDVLSAFFWFLSLYLYYKYVSKPKLAIYILSLFSFVMGLMSKPMLVTLPIIMLLMDFWPLNRYAEDDSSPRYSFSRAITLIKEKIPFFACSFLIGIITIYAQHQRGAAVSLDDVPFGLRIENALVSYVKYIDITLWPHNLGVFYIFPLWIPVWQVISSSLFLLVVSVTVIKVRHQFPYLVTGWFWFLITLVPVIGITQVGMQSMADRFAYIPGIGLFIMVAWGIPLLAKKRMRYRETLLALLAVVVIFISTALTWQQIGYWRNNVTLYQHTLKVTTGNYVIHCSLGHALFENGDLDGAIREYQETLRLNPFRSTPHYDLAVAFDRKGDLDAAIQEYRAAIQIDPDEMDAHMNLGVALARKGSLDQAILEFMEALRISPHDEKARANLDIALTQKQRGNL